MPDNKILLKSLSAKPAADTVIKKTVEIKAPQEDEATDSAYLGRRRSSFMLKPGRILKSKTGEEVGRMFEGFGDFAGKRYMIQKGDTYAREYGRGDVDLKKLHEEHQEAMKSHIPDKPTSPKEEEKKPMSEENVSKLNIALKSMKKP
jgi:hypothetical protein